MVKELLEKPVLKPELHTYSSGCLLSSPYGAMKGYFMINFTSTKNFKVLYPHLNYVLHLH
jgi:ApaG protein